MGNECHAADCNTSLEKEEAASKAEEPDGGGGSSSSRLRGFVLVLNMRGLTD